MYRGYCEQFLHQCHLSGGSPLTYATTVSLTHSTSFHPLKKNIMSELIFFSFLCYKPLRLIMIPLRPTYFVSQTDIEPQYQDAAHQQRFGYKSEKCLNAQNKQASSKGKCCLQICSVHLLLLFGGQYSPSLFSLHRQANMKTYKLLFAL